jgi:hypothetical protein
MSKTIASLVIIVLGYVGFADFFIEAEVATTIDNIMQIVGMIGVWYGRYMTNGEPIDVVGLKMEEGDWRA